MRTLRMSLGIAVCLGLFAFGAAAQDPMPQHEHGAAGAAPMADMKGMDHMMMGHGMAANGDVTALFEKLNRNVAALQAEKKPAVRKQLLADQTAMLKELQGKVGGGGMAGMGDMKCCSGMAARGDSKMEGMAGMNCGGMDMNKGMKMPDSKIPEAK